MFIRGDGCLECQSYGFLIFFDRSIAKPSESFKKALENQEYEGMETEATIISVKNTLNNLKR
jgi:hypothetical protein